MFAHAAGEQRRLYLEAAEEEIRSLTGTSRPDSPCSHSGKSMLARSKNPLVKEVLSIFETGLPTNKTKRQPAEWEKIFASNTSHKGLISKLYKERIKFKNK